jgi:hypothetical protein
MNIKTKLITFALLAFGAYTLFSYIANSFAHVAIGFLLGWITFTIIRYKGDPKD